MKLFTQFHVKKALLTKEPSQGLIKCDVFVDTMVAVTSAVKINISAANSVTVLIKRMKTVSPE